MSLTHDQITRFLRSVHPYDSLSDEALQELGVSFEVQILETDAHVYRLGQKLDGLYLIYSGTVEVTDENGAAVSHLGLRNSFGERGLLRDGVAVTSARC